MNVKSHRRKDGKVEEILTGVTALRCLISNLYSLKILSLLIKGYLV